MRATRLFCWFVRFAVVLPALATGAELPAAPEDGGPRNFEVSAAGGLNLRERPTTAAPVLTRYPNGTWLDNLGCQEAEGRAWCDVQQLGGGPRGYVAAEFLRPAVAPHGAVATGPDDSALRAGQFGVARAGGGYATVIVSHPDGRNRAIFFRAGMPIGADTSEADGYHEFSASKEGDLHFIRVGPERYEVVDAVVLGG